MATKTSALNFELFPLPDPEEGLDAFAEVTEQDRRDARAEQEASDLARALASLRRRYFEVKAGHQERGGRFGSKDAHVDLLTRAAQADLTDHEYLFALAVHGEIIAPEHLKIIRGEAPDISGKQAHRPEIEAAWLQDIRDSAAVSYLLLSDLVDGLVSPDVVAWINDNFRAISVFLVLDRDGQPAPIGQALPLENLAVSKFIQGGGIKSGFADEMRIALTGILTTLRVLPLEAEESTVRLFAMRCEECNCPSVPIKPRQRFCSPRCGSRNGQRRRRAERKS